MNHLIHLWYGDLRSTPIKRTTETHHLCDRWSKVRDDPSIICVTDDPAGVLAKLRPIFANWKEAQRITDQSHMRQLAGLREVRDAAVREALR